MIDKLYAALSNLGDKLLGWFNDGVAMLPNLALAVLVVVLAALAGRFLGRWACRGLRRFSDNDAITSLLGTVIRIVTLIGGVFIALGLLHLDKTVTSLLAGVGVIGLALGFAFQDIAANFMSGIILAFRGPFDVGDIVKVSDQTGTVEEVRLRSLIMRTFDGLSVVIPNKQVFQNVLVNYTRTNERRVDVSVGVGYGDDLEKAREVAIEAVSGYEGRDPEREVELFYTGFGSSSIDFDLRFWLDASHQSKFLDARSEAIILIKKAFDDNGITIPFPIRTLDFGAKSAGGESMDAMELWDRKDQKAS